MWIPLAADDLNIPGWSVGWYFQVPQVGSYLDRFWLQMTSYTQKSTLDTTLHSGATPLLRGFSRKNICCQKIFGNSFSFQATEMVLTSKWGRIQQEIQI